MNYGVLCQEEKKCCGGPPRYRPLLTETSHYTDVSQLLSDAHALWRWTHSNSTSPVECLWHERTSIVTSPYTAQIEERFSTKTIIMLSKLGGVCSPDG